MQHLRPHLLLILATDPLAAALLGAAAEVSGISVAYPRPDESPRDALRRVRPTVALVVPSRGARPADELLGPAMMLGARVVLAGPRETEPAMGRLAREHELPAFVLPGELDALLADLRGGGPSALPDDAASEG